MNKKILCALITILNSIQLLYSISPIQKTDMTLIHLGSGYGGRKVPTNILHKDSICYCFGAGEDISFDLDLIKLFSCNAYSFDPTPRSIKHIEYLKNCLINNKNAYINQGSTPYTASLSHLKKLHFVPIGLWIKNEVQKFFVPKNPHHISHSIVNLQKTDEYFDAPCKTLSTIMQDLNHDHIDLLKLDIEGAEYEVLLDMIKSDIFPSIVCVEFHAIPHYDKNKMIELLLAHYDLVDIYNTDYTFLKKTGTNRTNQEYFHEFFLDLFPKDPVRTEYEAYLLLKDNPIESEHYVAIPWAFLINSKQLDRVPNIHVPGGFTVCQHIYYEKIIPILEKMGIDTLFTPHAQLHKKISNKIKIMPLAHFAVNGIPPSSSKNIFYSFVGTNTHWTRKEIFTMKHPKEAVILQRKNWHWWGKNQEQEKVEYQDILARSRFSLCPRGTGPSTIRFWESLQAGAIPVVIADDFVLPDGFNWKEAIIQIPEKNTKSLNDVLQKISPEQEKRMRVNCLRAFHLFSGENFISNIRLYYKK